MDMLPRDIADLCGIQMDRSPPAPVAGCRMPEALTLTQGEDGVYTLSYRGETLGWIGPIKLDRREGNAYRAISATGMVKHCWSLGLAKEYLIETAI